MTRLLSSTAMMSLLNLTKFNATENYSVANTDHYDDDEEKVWRLTIYGWRHTVVTSVVLGLMVLTTIVGNSFVIAAIVIEKNLHGVANYLVVSLAVADLMVGSMVMPLSALNEVSSVWFLSNSVCDMWISFDVLCCTASILHLLAISIDRYWAVTNIDYIRLGRSPRRIILMIALAWVTALCISIPPLFGWKEAKDNPAITGKCIISQDAGYTIFSTVGAFYLPMLAMMVIYLRIYQVARRTIRRKKFSPSMKSSTATAFQTSVIDENSSETKSPSSRRTRKHGKAVLISRTSVSSIQHDYASDEHKHAPNTFSPLLSRVQNGVEERRPVRTIHSSRDKQRDKLEQKRERKAARTLGIITGSFIICWLPFFIVAIVAPFKHKDFVPHIVNSVVLWLGYLNSTLNPVIYTIFSPDFRGAFKKILFRRYSERSRTSFR